MLHCLEETLEPVFILPGYRRDKAGEINNTWNRFENYDDNAAKVEDDSYYNNDDKAADFDDYYDDDEAVDVDYDYYDDEEADLDDDNAAHVDNDYDDDDDNALILLWVLWQCWCCRNYWWSLWPLIQK